MRQGRLEFVVVTSWSDAEARAAILDVCSRDTWTFLASMRDPDSAVLTAARVQMRLTQAGFQVLSESALPSGTPDRWSSEWVVIEASRQHLGP
jgi:hypothetical protein